MRISLSFADSQVFIAMPINKRLFEAPSILDTFLKPGHVIESLGYLSMCIETAEALDLNTRVWT